MMGRILGPVDYGTLASIFAVIYILSIVPLSSSVAVVKFVSSAKSDAEVAGIFGKIKSFIFQIALVLFVIYLIGSPVIAKFLHIDNLLVVALVAPYLFFSLMSLAYQSTLQGLLKFWGVVGPSLVSSVFKLVLGLLLVYLGWSVMGAMVGLLVAVVLSWGYVRRLGRQIPAVKKREEFSVGVFLKFSVPVLLQALAFTSLFTTDVILVKHFLSAFDAGLYAAISTLGKIIYFASQPVTSVMFPIVAGKKSRGEKYRDVFYLSLGATMAISLGIVLFYYLLPGVAIGLLYGEEYLAAKTELVWMGMFLSVYALSYLLVNFLLSVGRTRIVILPLAAGVVQVVALMNWHGSLLEVIQVSLVVTTLMAVGLLVYLVNHQLKFIYAKK